MRTVLLLPVAFCISGLLFAQPKVAKELGRVNPEDSVNVLVRYKRTIDDAQIDKIKKRGGAELGRFVNTGHAMASVPAGKLQDLSTAPDIEYIAPDRPVKANLDVSHAQPGPNGGKPGKYWGTELDARISYRYLDHFVFDLEGAILFPGDALRNADGFAARSTLVQGRSTFYF